MTAMQVGQVALRQCQMDFGVSCCVAVPSIMWRTRRLRRIVARPPFSADPQPVRLGVDDCRPLRAFMLLYRAMRGDTGSRGPSCIVDWIFRLLDLLSMWRSPLGNRDHINFARKCVVKDVLQTNKKMHFHICE